MNGFCSADAAPTLRRSIPFRLQGAGCRGASARALRATFSIAVPLSDQRRPTSDTPTSNQGETDLAKAHAVAPDVALLSRFCSDAHVGDADCMAWLVPRSGQQATRCLGRVSTCRRSLLRCRSSAPMGSSLDKVSPSVKHCSGIHRGSSSYGAYAAARAGARSGFMERHNSE
jgi:hypothetical protein